MRKLFRLAAMTSVVIATVAMTAGVAGAAETHSHVNACSGTVTAPGLLAGYYQGDVVVTRVCAVNGGAAVIKGNLILAPGSALNATFALNDEAGTGTSSLTVFSNLVAGSDAVLAMGCEPNFFPCSDDPNAGTGGTLTSQDHVFGSLTALQALTVIVHASTIDRNMTFAGGGGGVSCNVPTTGVLAALQSPPYLDAEDNTVGGSLVMAGIKTCWLGALRNQVGRNLVSVTNTMADPDAGEILANVVGGNIACFRNSPAVQFGDSESTPNQIKHSAFGECAFSVTQPNPPPSGPLEPISVKI